MSCRPCLKLLHVVTNKKYTFFNMSDLKIAKKSKSKVNNNNDKSTKLASQCSTKSNVTVKSSNARLTKKQSSSTTGTILNKLDLENLKETALKNLRKGVGFPTALVTREACIEYTLDMVVTNLVNNGYLPATKVQKIKSPAMFAEIAAIVDDMISAKTEISMASTAKYYRARKKSGSKSRSRSQTRPKTQKWAIQPAALPITIVADHQSLTKLPKFATLEKNALSTKETKTKSSRNVSADNVKKQRSNSKPKNKTKSLDSSSERNTKQVSQPLPVQSERKYAQQASSEVPSSNHSLENNAKRLSNTSSNIPANNPSSNTNVEQQAAKEVRVSESTKQTEDGNQNVISTETNENSKTIDDNKNNKNVSDEAPDNAISSPQVTRNVDRNQVFSPLPVTNPPTVRTLNTLIDGSCSNTSSTISPVYQTMVDMKGFHNDEISMEVEGRQLIFLASRGKRDELNVRKVTEIVEVPVKVKMENLKIGRRTDGYVIIEEHDS